MTGRELIQWIIDNDAQDLTVEVQYRDSGGYYFGTDADIKPEIDCDDEGRRFYL